MKLKGSLVMVSDLSVPDKYRMFELLSSYFYNVDFRHFEKDLQEKQWIILLKDQISSEIQGFSTQVLLKTVMNGREYRALFSGDTIIKRDYWNQTELMRIWGLLALRLIDEYQGEELFWFLISMGYKTYRFLPVFFKEFYPCYQASTPPGIKMVIDAFASLKCPGEYDPLTGVIRMSPPCMKLKEGVSDITEQLLRNPHINFFVKNNPFHYQGDELACIARLSRENFNRAAYKMINAKVAAL